MPETAPHQGIQDHPRSHYKRLEPFLERVKICNLSQFDSVVHSLQVGCGWTAASCYHSVYAVELAVLPVHASKEMVTAIPLSFACSSIAHLPGCCLHTHAHCGGDSPPIPLAGTHRGKITGSTRIWHDPSLAKWTPGGCREHTTSKLCWPGVEIYCQVHTNKSEAGNAASSYPLYTPVNEADEM